MERHRLVWLFFKRRTNLFQQPRKKMLHIAPETAYGPLLSRNPAIDYLTGDYAPSRAMVQMDITDIHYPDGSFDVIYCSHVLEHVHNDRKAMRELRRVLTSDGWAVLLVPIFPEPTFEDASIVDPCARERVFGQWDHVRRYGPDFRQRLEEAGFDVQVFRPEEIASPEEVGEMAIRKDEYIFYCTKSLNI
jgi:SAM-dependent methyltransferase